MNYINGLKIKENKSSLHIIELFGISYDVSDEKFGMRYSLYSINSQVRRFTYCTQNDYHYDGYDNHNNQADHQSICVYLSREILQMFLSPTIINKNTFLMLSQCPSNCRISYPAAIFVY
jgi:hypothetical protein